MVGSEVFSYEIKALICSSLWGEWICGAQSLKERGLLCKPVFNPIEKQTLILKMVERNVFLMKPMHHYHLSQWGEFVCGAQSWNKGRLFCKFVFI